MISDHLTPEEEPVCSAWPRLVQAVLVLFLAISILIFAFSFIASNPAGLQQQIHRLTSQVEELKQEQAMPAFVLNRYRNSICYIFGIYEIGFPNQRPLQRTRISGSGFVVANGLIATNRHVAEPWYGDADADPLIAKGATAHLEKLVAYFPGSPAPVSLTPAALSSDGDLAVVRMNDLPFTLEPLPLAKDIPDGGELVGVVGFPMGVLGIMWR